MSYIYTYLQILTDIVGYILILLEHALTCPILSDIVTYLRLETWYIVRYCLILIDITCLAPLAALPPACPNKANLLPELCPLGGIFTKLSERDMKQC